MLRLFAIVGVLLLAVGAHAQEGVDWSQAAIVNLLMENDHFLPDRLMLRQGVPYLIHMENHGAEVHLFTAPDLFADAVVRDQGLLANEGAEVEVPAGWAVDLYLVPLKAGTYPLICADHELEGMVGEIVVE